MTKSSERRSDIFIGHTSRPYIKTQVNIYINFTICNRTSSDAILPTITGAGHFPLDISPSRFRRPRTPPPAVSSALNLFFDLNEDRLTR